MSEIELMREEMRDARGDVRCEMREGQDSYGAYTTSGNKGVRITCMTIISKVQF